MNANVTDHYNLGSDELRRLHDEGYLVLKDVLTHGECAQWTQTIDEAWEHDQQQEHNYTEEPGVQFVQNLLRHSQIFQRCVVEPAVLAAVRAVIGSEVFLSVINGRRSEPGYGNQPLHDLNRRRGEPFTRCDAIWCLDPFTPANGTRVLPGSHLASEPFLSRMSDPTAPHPDEEIVVAPRGAVVVFNAALIHAGRKNDGGAPRRSIQTQFASPGEPLGYDWSALPAEVRQRLSPATRRVLALDS